MKISPMWRLVGNSGRPREIQGGGIQPSARRLNKTCPKDYFAPQFSSSENYHSNTLSSLRRCLNKTCPKDFIAPPSPFFGHRKHLALFPRWAVSPSFQTIYLYICIYQTVYLASFELHTKNSFGSFSKLLEFLSFFSSWRLASLSCWTRRPKKIASRRRMRRVRMRGRLSATNLNFSSSILVVHNILWIFSMFQIFHICK